MRYYLVAAVVFVAFLALSATVVRNDAPAAGAEGDGIKVFFDADKFDAEGYVNSIWDGKVMPYMREKAVDALELRKELQADANAAGAKHGYRAVAEQNPYNFAVKGRVRILSANVKSKNGRVEADAAPFDGTADIVMQIGPVYKGTSIRDFLDFVTFDDFKNQVEFAKLAAQLNLHVRDTVIAPLDILGDGGVGKEFDMLGATTFEKAGVPLNVVPVELKPASE